MVPVRVLRFNGRRRGGDLYLLAEFWRERMRPPGVADAVTALQMTWPAYQQERSVMLAYIETLLEDLGDYLQNQVVLVPV